MKAQQKVMSHCKKDHTNKFMIIWIVIALIQFIFHFTVWAVPIQTNQLATPDSIKLEIDKGLTDQALLQQLNFPNTVKRFYVLNSGEGNWLRPDQNIGPTASAMLLLDCVRQFGLLRENYHPTILNYGVMHDVLSSKSLLTSAQKTAFEIMLTDAMISMIYDLHYGAFNPNLGKNQIDKGIKEGLLAEQLLQRIKNSANLMDSILEVQPKVEQYRQLQGYMKLIAGQYTCDSYETPEADIRAIAYNMERLRWNELKGEYYIHINIPSFQLVYRTPITSHLFKVVVGKGATPTPTILGLISHLQTAPDWKVPSKIFLKEMLPKAMKDHAYFENNHIAVYDQKENFVPITTSSINIIFKNPHQYHLKQTAGCDNALGKVVFRFTNSFDIYLHDTPEQSYFNKVKRALSHGCIRVENAEKLAVLVLQNDQQSNRIKELNSAMHTYKRQTFWLKTPLPILITYLTTTVEDGLLVKHEDIYHLDAALGAEMYGQSFSLNRVAIK